jgi:hypothetical protein
MYRVAILALVAITVTLGLIDSTPPRSMARSASASPEATPAATLDGLCNVGMPATPPTWESADVRPTGYLDAAAILATPVAATPEASPAPATPEPDMVYLVVITLPPGHCMPYSAVGNDKEGAIVMIVQQGIVEYQWEPTEEGILGSAPVRHGDESGHAPPPYKGAADGEVLERVPILLYPGDWIRQNQRVQFSYRNVGGDSAVILKAVWTVYDPGGCGGGCK